VKRWITRKRFCLFLLLIFGGVILNVAVAWVVPQFRTLKIVFLPFPSNIEPLERSSSSVGVLASDASLTSFGRQLFYGWACNCEIVFATDGVNNRSMVHMSSGWPMRCLEGRDTTGIGLENAFELPEFLPGNRSVYGMYFLPTKPLLSGFVIDTLFYAAILWMLFAAPFVLRKRRRIKRGLCLKCAYNLGASNIPHTQCPECGTTISA
jgi:hypothetical protein